MDGDADPDRTPSVGSVVFEGESAKKQRAGRKIVERRGLNSAGGITPPPFRLTSKQFYSIKKNTEEGGRVP